MSQSLVDILIVFNAENEMEVKQSHRLFDWMKRSITESIGRNKYTIYRIDSNEMTATDVWQTKTALLITIGDQSIDEYLKAENNCFNGQHMNFGFTDLLIASDSDHNCNDFRFNCDYFTKQLNTYLNIDSKNNLNKSLNEFELNDRKDSKIYLISKETNDLFIEKYKHLIEPKMRLIDGKQKNSVADNDGSNSRKELIISADLKDISFDSNTYFSNLKTKRFGLWMAFADITESTMSLIEPFKGIDGFIAVTNQQTNGRGRHQNQWLSPPGQAMFTIQLSVDLKSNIGRKMAFIQHLAGLAIVEGIYSKAGYEVLSLGLKWPNDILWRRTRTKVTGILVTSEFANQRVNVLIGCGINVHNSDPSLCLNHIIDEYNSHSIHKLDYLKCEEVIARTVTQLERLMDWTEEENGLQLIKDLYLKHWIHSGEVIKVLDKSTERTARIEGLDSDGYLLVRDLSDGSALSLQPDGNRFDISRNLIIARKHTYY